MFGNHPPAVTTFRIPAINSVQLRVKFVGPSDEVAPAADATITVARRTKDFLAELRTVIAMAVGVDAEKVGAMKAGPVELKSQLDVHQLKANDLVTAALLP